MLQGRTKEAVLHRIGSCELVPQLAGRGVEDVHGPPIGGAVELLLSFRTNDDGAAIRRHSRTCSGAVA